VEGKEKRAPAAAPSACGIDFRWRLPALGADELIDVGAVFLLFVGEFLEGFVIADVVAVAYIFLAVFIVDPAQIFYSASHDVTSYELVV